MLCASFPMTNNFEPFDLMGAANDSPPQMPSAVSFASGANNERATSLPVNAARAAPSEPRSVSFSNSVSFNFPAPGSPTQFPGRIESSVTRQSTLGSIGEFDLSFSSLDGVFDSKPKSGDDAFLEPEKVFDSKPSASFNGCREDDLRTLLHRTCQQFPRKKEMIKNALKKDPSAVRRRAFVLGKPNKAGGNVPPEPYQLPINIALTHKASVDVLDLLVRADPTQLVQKDGIHGANSLCLALETRPNDCAVLGMFLVNNPEMVKTTCDNRSNTPLHVACQRGASFPIVRQLFQLYPAALMQRNESGKTPVDILEQQARVCPKAKHCLEYFQQKIASYKQQKNL